jgi:putative tricarboxylic transport membrane protein
VNKTFDIIGVLFVICFGIFYLYLTEHLPKIHLGDAVGPEGYPRILGIGIIATGFVLLIIQLRRWYRVPGRLVPSEGEADDPAYPVSYFRVIFLILTVFLYLYLLPFIGYLLATPAFLSAILALSGIRTLKSLLVLPWVFTLLLFIVFGILARVRLPMGPLEFLNQFIARFFS